MQPYFFPYIGYFQLMNAVDEFVVYDNIQYTKKGWINRNRILLNGKIETISLAIKKDSDYLDIRDRCLADNWIKERSSILNRLKSSYQKAPYFIPTYTLVEKILKQDSVNLFEFLFNSLQLIKEYLHIPTPLIISSQVPVDHTLKSSERVLAICKALQANQYINPIGGTELYTKEHFLKNGVALQFLRTQAHHYQQFNKEHVPYLSIIDVMMFNSQEALKDLLQEYILE